MNLLFHPVVKYRPFIIEIDTTKTGSASNTFILPLAAGQLYNFFVEWGDGTAEKVTSSSSVTHVYPASGIYQVKVHGYGFGRRFPQILFNNGGDRQKLLRILQWGDVQWGTFTNAFRGCVNLTTIANDKIKLFGLGSLQTMFQGCTNLNSPIPSFDTRNVITTLGMFYDCAALKQDISNINILSLVNATSMLFGTNINDTGTTTRYDALLNAWAAQPFQPNVTFHGGTAKYSSAASAARATLVSAGWTITDGGLL